MAALAFFTLVAVHGWDTFVPGLLDRTGRLKCQDFLQFYTYGSLAAAGQSSQLYEAAAHERMARERVDPREVLSGFRPNYSPVIAWLMAPLSTLPYLRAMAVWTGISVALYVLSIALLLPCAPLVRNDLVSLWLAALAWPVLFEVLRYGQISTMSLAFVALAVRLSNDRRHLLAGLALGCLAFKPNLLIAPLVILLCAREWRLLAGLCAGALLQTAIAIGSVGLPVFREYVAILMEVARHPESIQRFPSASHSVSGAVRLLTGSPALMPWSTALAFVAATFSAWWIWKTTTDVRARWSALVLATLLSSPHLLTYDLVLLAIPILLLGDWHRHRFGEWPQAVWLAAIVLMYAGAWPGTLLARAFRIQISTIGMGLALWLLLEAFRDAAAETGLLAVSERARRA